MTQVLKLFLASNLSPRINYTDVLLQKAGAVIFHKVAHSMVKTY